jgi:hypothetical protein
MPGESQPRFRFETVLVLLMFSIAAVIATIALSMAAGVDNHPFEVKPPSISRSYPLSKPAACNLYHYGSSRAVDCPTGIPLPEGVRGIDFMSSPTFYCFGFLGKPGKLICGVYPWEEKGVKTESQSVWLYTGLNGTALNGIILSKEGELIIEVYLGEAITPAPQTPVPPPMPPELHGTKV